MDVTTVSPGLTAAMSDSNSLSNAPVQEPSPTPPLRVDARTKVDAYELQHARRSSEFHWIWLILAMAVLVISALLSNSGETAVYWPGTRTPLPTMCHMKRITGLDCPGCGLTRCFISLAHGEVTSALHFNPAGVFLFGLLVAQIPYRWLQIQRLKAGREEWRHRRLSVVLTVVFVSLLMIQWFWKLLLVSGLWNG